MAATGHTDHIVHLHFAAGADAKIAVDAGVEIDLHRHMAVVEKRDAFLLDGGKAAIRDALLIGHRPEVGGFVMRRVALRLIGDQEFHHHGARLFGPLAAGVHHHAFARLPHAGGGQRPLSLDLHHAGAAVAVGPIAGFIPVAKMRNPVATGLRDFPDGLARLGGYGFAVEHEGDLVGHRVRSPRMMART